VRRQLLQLATPLPPAAADSGTADSAVAAACSDALRLLLLLRATPSMDESALRCALQDLVNSLDVDAVLAALPPVTTTTTADTTAAAAATSGTVDDAGTADDSTMSDSDAAEAAGSHDTRVEYIDDMATDDAVQASTAGAEATDVTIVSNGSEQ
jgi:hypothetical protein